MNTDIQTLFNQFAESIKTDNLADKQPLVLGNLIEALRRQPGDSPCMVEMNAVLSDFGGLDSYRGYYSDLAIEPSSAASTVRDSLDALTDAVGSTFTGYKGGNYTMTAETLVWVSYYGECSGFLVTGVEERDGVAVITTTADDA